MGKVNFDGISNRVMELANMVKDRKGRLSDEERLELLHELFDCSLIRAVKSAVSGDSKFSSTAILFMDSAMNQIKIIEQQEIANNGKSVAFDIPGLDPSVYDQDRVDA